MIVITALDLSAADRARLNSGVENILLKSSFERDQFVEILRRLVARMPRPENVPTVLS